MKKSMFVEVLLVMVLLCAVFASPLAASTPTPTPTIVASNKVFFQPTPAPGKITVVPAVGPITPSWIISKITIDSLDNTANGCFIRLYNGSVLLRYFSVVGWTFPTEIDMYGIKANTFAVDFMENTGTSTTVTK